MRGPLKILKDTVFVPGLSGKSNVVDLFSRTRERLRHACAVAKEALSWSQKKIKHCFDKRAVEQHFAPGEKVKRLHVLQDRM